MSDEGDEIIEKPFCIEIAKQGRAACKKCKEKCEKNQLRIGKLQNNPFGSGKMKAWYHIDCLFDVFAKQKQTTKRIDNPSDDIDGWDTLSDIDKENLIKKINECNEKFGIEPINNNNLTKTNNDTTIIKKEIRKNEIKDNLFREFRRLVADISNTNSYKEKTNIIKKQLINGCTGNGFKGDIYLWCRLLLPGFVKRIYNLKSKQLIKLFSKIFNKNINDMLEHLKLGDVGETIKKFFIENNNNEIKQLKNSQLTLMEVDEFLNNLSKLTKEDEQIKEFKLILPKCTANDLKTIIHLIKHDLRMNAGAKHVLDAIHSDAYNLYQNLHNLNYVIKYYYKTNNNNNNNNIKKINIMTPILPMLAEPCKNIEYAFKKYPNGMFSEIKYDGERVQLHKLGDNFKYFSRSLKPVMEHKIKHFKNFIPKAFPYGNELILDCEILMIDNNNGKPLPFGTLGLHKKNQFQNANVCLFVFDCIYYNGEILIDKPIKERKEILKNIIIEIPNHIVLSEMKEIFNKNDLKFMIIKVLKLGLEGLVLKDINSPYKPGKRHWLKIKKDYLFDGAMADCADLIVLGAWYGTGKKGGMMSIFLMGVYDEINNKFCTVTKVHQGLDDKTLELLQNKLKMIKINGDTTKIPLWLNCTNTMVPDFVAEDPKNQPIWEISGAEFTQQHDVHTADGISIRFPRITKFRNDKNWKNATTLLELKKLYKKSKEETTDISLLMKDIKEETTETIKQQLIQESSRSKGKKRKLSKDNKTPKQSKVKIENDSGPSTFNIVLEKPIPNYFENIYLIVDDEALKVHSNLIKYFIGYGGNVLEPQNSDNATHYLHLNKISKNTLRLPKNKNIMHIVIDWIRDSIYNGAPLTDLRPYLVTWKPN